MSTGLKTAVYIRLSSEDTNVDGINKTESDSVGAQRLLLMSYAMATLGKGENEIAEYVDDGISGTHFNRLGFQTLLEDMRSGLIDCVIVKDFFRFGRDYLEVEYYLEYIFPLLHIRFISVNDGYDSLENTGMTGGMNVALKNIVNNMYSRDLSKKVTSAIKTRSKNGTRLPARIRYGYRKKKDGRLEIDPDLSEIVRMIFQMAAEGKSFAAITRELNAQGIQTSAEYQTAHGRSTHFRKFETIRECRWTPTTVADIVRDEIYVGVRIWGKTRCGMDTYHKTVVVDEADWIRLENEHEAIVDRKLFDLANSFHPQKKRKVGESQKNGALQRRKKEHAFLLCGHALTGETKNLLKCNDGRTSADPVCRKLAVRREPLEENILEYVRKYAEMARQKTEEKHEKAVPREPVDSDELNKKATKISVSKVKLYEDYRNGEFSSDSYRQQSDALQKELEQIQKTLQAESIRRSEEAKEAQLPNAETWGSLAGMKTFDKEKLRQVIKAIYVYSQDEIEIEWNFDDPFNAEKKQDNKTEGNP